MANENERKAKPNSPMNLSRRLLMRMWPHSAGQPSSSRSVVTLAIAAVCLLSILFTNTFGSNSSNASLLENSTGFKTKTPFVATPAELTSQLKSYLPSSSVTGVSCADVHARVERGEWQDPNRGYVYARTLASEPPFVVAVHEQAYDHMRWKSIYVKGAYYETQVHNRFVQILRDKPSSLVIDVGMNIGYYSLLSAALGHVVMGFEINPANLMRMCESLDLNRNHHLMMNHHHQNSQHASAASPVAVFRRGVSDVDGQVLHLVVPKNPGEATLEETSSNEINAHSVSTITLDTFATEQSWLDTAAAATHPKPTIRLLKIDVEGHEPEIILGAQKLLRSGLVQNILTEYRDYGSPATRRAFDILLDAGYTIVHEGVLLTKAESQGFYQDLWHNRVRTNKDVRNANARQKIKSYFKKQAYSDLWFSCPTCESGAILSR